MDLYHTLLVAVSHWTKTPRGYSLGSAELVKVGRTWTLVVDGVAHILGRRASFDHAEDIINSLSPAS